MPVNFGPLGDYGLDSGKFILERIYMKPDWIDAHCHIVDIPPKFLADVLSRCVQAGVGKFLMGGVDPRDWALQKSLAGSLAGCFRSAGLHPWSASLMDDAECDAALEELKNFLDGASAFGEIGLDRAIRGAAESYPRQLRIFRAQLDMVRNYRLPLILHVVRAHAQALEVLEDTFSSGWKGMVHDFQGGVAEARRYVSLGFLISLGPRAEGKLKAEFFGEVPPSSIVLETDSPHVPGVSKSERSGSGPFPDAATPLRVLQVAQWAAGMSGESAEIWLERSATNLQREFSLCR